MIKKKIYNMDTPYMPTVLPSILFNQSPLDKLGKVRGATVP